MLMPCPRCSRSRFPTVPSREMPGARRPADVAAAIGPGLAKAALAGRGRWRSARSSSARSRAMRSLALITSRDEKDALELVRHDFAHVLAEAVQKLFPAPRSPSVRRPTTAFTTTSRPAAGRGPVHRRGPARDRGRDAADHRRATSRWSAKSGSARTGPRVVRASRARRFKAEWVMELPEGEPITMYRTGPWRERLDRPVPRAASRLDRQARPEGVQADPCVGRLLARRPEQPDAAAHLWHRLAQQEAAPRASRPAGGSGQARPSQDRAGDGPVPPPGRSAWQRLLAPQRLS